MLQQCHSCQTMQKLFITKKACDKYIWLDNVDIVEL